MALICAFHLPKAFFSMLHFRCSFQLLHRYSSLPKLCKTARSLWARRWTIYAVRLCVWKIRKLLYTNLERIPPICSFSRCCIEVLGVVTLASTIWTPTLVISMNSRNFSSYFFSNDFRLLVVLISLLGLYFCIFFDFGREGLRSSEHNRTMLCDVAIVLSDDKFHAWEKGLDCIGHTFILSLLSKSRNVSAIIVKLTGNEKGSLTGISW